MRLTDFVAADGAELLRALSRREHDAPQPIDIDLIGQQGESVPARLLVLKRRLARRCDRRRLRRRRSQAQRGAEWSLAT